MNIKIKYVKDAGNIKKERIVLGVKADDDAGNYMIADTTYLSDGMISNKLRHTFWIPDKKINERDSIIIYTKPGKDKTRENDDGTKSHFFYWDLDISVWNKSGDTAVVIQVQTWITKNILEQS